MLRYAYLLGLATMAMAPVAAQQSTPTTLPDASSPNDVIVSALRIPREKLPTQIEWDQSNVLGGRIAREKADMFLRCATKISRLSTLRRIVDGIPNSADARTAQGSLLAASEGCYPPEHLAARYAAVAGPFSSPYTIAPIDLGTSSLDRGVIMERVLMKYAPDAALTRAQTENIAIRERFNIREEERNRLRQPGDLGALRFASCLVRRQPELATRLVKSAPGTDLERGLTQTIIIEARECVGDAKRVTIDPNVIRVYIVDAFYRWVVAARGVDSLIPKDA